jgi:hypothetical protein
VVVSTGHWKDPRWERPRAACRTTLLNPEVAPAWTARFGGERTVR